MSVTNRQNRLLLSEDWRRIYQTFRNADFTSYDFDSLRRTMISYIRENYPEDFNDYIDSSEYLALIDLIAFLGQNISYRIDLNSRENFLELAERRDSVLRLARLLSYNPKRNQCANGLIKFEAVSTTEEVVDSNGTNLATQTVVWNDPSNADWREQFEKIMNVALPINATIGKPIKKDTVEGILTHQYRYKSSNTGVPVYTFSKSIDGRNLQFQIVSSDVSSGTISEEPPLPGNSLAFLYRDDGRGPGSSNSGYFCHFRQGVIDQGVFSVDAPSTNQSIAIDASNVNNTDVWLYSLNAIGSEAEIWTKVDAVEGNNIVYNSVRKKIRNIFGVLTKGQDKISLIFSDGTFGNLPKGDFRVYYRSSINQSYNILPEDLTSIGVSVPYISAAGNQETLSLTLSLKYTVDNSSTSESNLSIKENAPATYYTQNRMVTGEDYQVAPLGVSQEIIKVKTVNRASSGISRYFDLLDSTGKYSSTNLFGNDGVIYKETLTKHKNFTFLTKVDIEGQILNTIEPILSEKQLLNYYLTTFPKTIVADLGASWVQTTKGTNFTTGNFVDTDSTKYQLGTYAGSSLRFVEPGTLLKFIAPAGYHFMKDGTLMQGNPDHIGALEYKWVKVISVVGDGTINTTAGAGPVTLNDVLPTNAILSQVVPKFSRTLQSAVKTQLNDQIYANKTFGLRYDVNLRQWRVIIENNLNITGTFSTGKTGDTTNQRLDASWLLLFETNGEKYTITYRSLRYVFESANEIRFYYDSSDKVYDNKTGQIIKDKITVLSINLKPDLLTPFTVDSNWEITLPYRDANGYVDTRKVEISFYDADEDGVVDDPETFVQTVNETVNPLTKYIFQKKYITSDGLDDYKYINNATESIIVKKDQSFVGALSLYTEGQVFYLDTEKVFKKLTSGALALTTDYKAYIGRSDLKFQYIHAADDDNRIDPSSSNIMDTYLLTKSYDALFRDFLDGTVATKPLPPSSDNLFNNYGGEINKVKSISDEVIYHPVKYKILFGANADLDLQATFKIVKNPDQVVNSNALKASVISSINQFFALDNWDFGDTFYFSELSTYVMATNAPDLVTMVVVPNQTLQGFGSLYEIKSESDEIFISGATVDNIEIIDSITASRLKASGKVLTEATSTNSGIQSANVYTSGSITTSSEGTNI